MQEEGFEVEVGFQYQPDPVGGTTKVSFWEFAAEGLVFEAVLGW